VARDFVGVSNETAIACGVAANTLSCQATGGDVTIGAGTGRFAVALPVRPTARGPLTNPAGICQVDPEGRVTEVDETNNDCPADTVRVFVPHYLPLVLRQ
jgi:hypothetical protein